MQMTQRFLHSALTIAALGCAISFAQDDVGSDAQDNKLWINDDRGHLIFFAVLEGLYKDGVSDEVVASIIPLIGDSERHDETKNFVYACPLCCPAFEAFRLYSQRPIFQGLKPRFAGTTIESIDSFGLGLDAGLTQKLLSQDDTIRRPALQDLIAEWVARYIERMRLTPEEQAELELQMESGREKGMRSLRSGTNGDDVDWENCAVCDGAVGACALPPKADKALPDKVHESASATK